MSDSAARRPRADAERNRLALLASAKAVFEEKGSAASLEEIARRAGLGIGTLYRHFPHRDALVEAVYRKDSAELTAAADALVLRHQPVEALRQWLRLFVDHMATKTAMAELINSVAGGSARVCGASGTEMQDAYAGLVERAVAAGEIRLSVEPMDLLRALYGVVAVNAGPSAQESALKFVDILIAGIRTPPAG